MIVVLQVSPDATSQTGLELNPLYGTLQKIGKTRIVPIVPAQ